MADAVLLACIGVLVANLVVLGLVMKLYTEFAKDRFQSARAGGTGEGNRG